MKKLICLASLVLLFTGCVKADNGDGGGDYSADDDNSYDEEANFGYPTFEELKDAYPDKTVLVWVVPWYFTGHTVESTVMLNEVLVEKGTDYVVSFKVMENDYNLDRLYYPLFAENVMSYIDGGGQVDILTTESWGQSGMPGNIPIFTLKKNGYLANLEDFLDTEKGREIYGEYPPVYWKASEIEHHLYGIPLGASAGGGLYNYYNKKLADKHGLTADKMSLPPYEMEKIYKKIYEEESKTNPSFKIMRNASFGDYDLRWERFFFFEAIATRYDDFDVFKIYQHKETLEIIKTMTGYNKSNYCHDGYGDLLVDRIIRPDYYNTLNVLPPYEENPEDFYKVFSSKLPMQNITSQICLSSTTQNKESAFDLISRMWTDAELCAVMTDYTEHSPYDLAWDYSGVFNTLLCIPDKDGKTAKEIMFESSAELYEHDLLGFYIDYTGLSGDALSLSSIFDDYWGIANGSYKVKGDFYATAQALSDELDAADLDGFIEELNGQYYEWRNKS
jgi:hypothetical protein